MNRDNCFNCVLLCLRVQIIEKMRFSGSNFADIWDAEIECRAYTARVTKSLSRSWEAPNNDYNALGLYLQRRSPKKIAQTLWINLLDILSATFRSIRLQITVFMPFTCRWASCRRVKYIMANKLHRKIFLWQLFYL